MKLFTRLPFLKNLSLLNFSNQQTGLLLSCLLWGGFALGDYGWVPKYQHLWLKFGGDYYKTTSNYDRQGFTENTFNNTDQSEFSEIRFWVNPEYSFAKDWSMFMLTQFKQASVDDANGGSELLTATGVGDFVFGAKWNFKKHAPLLTIETSFKIPTNGNTNLAADDLLLGDGNLDWNFIFHTGYRIPPIFFTLSPGFRFRFGNYSNAFTLDAGVGGRIDRVYGLLYTHMNVAFEELLVFNSTLNAADAFGTGGSYTRLAESPTTIDLGLKFGFQIYKKYYVETYLQKSLSGRRAPNFIKFGLNFFLDLNFYKEIKKTRLKEVPLQEDENY